MASYDIGKAEAVRWIYEHFSKGSTCLDVGACDGKWSDLVGDQLIMDAVEIWEPYIIQHKLREKYRAVFNCDIKDFRFDHYDLIIYGDVLEHLDIITAGKVLDYARPRCSDMLIAVPFRYKQGPKNKNPYEIHLQADLTPELFDIRFPGFMPIYKSVNYAYYVKNKK